MAVSFTSDSEKYSQEKLQLIQLLLNTENPSVIKQVKELLTKNLPYPLTKNEVLNRAKESEMAYQDGKVLSIDELEGEAKNW